MLPVSVAGLVPNVVGNIALLGGKKEMPWRFDRLFKLEITKTLSDLGLRYDDDFTVHLDIRDENNNQLPEDTFSHSTILYQDAKGESAQGHFR